MNVETIVSSCEALIGNASESSIFKIYLFLILFTVPFLKTTISIIKTKSRIRYITDKCNNKIPAKLKNIIESHGLDQSKILISCNSNFTAMAIGFFDRKIIFSKTLINKLSKKELEAVFLHELHHLENHHASILFVTQIISETLFFMPVFKDVLFNIRSQFEKKADYAAVKYQNTNKFVKKSLLKLIKYSDDYVIFPQFSDSVINQRLDSLENKKQRVVFRYSRIALTFLFFVGAFLWSHLNASYIMASMFEQKNECNLLECARKCVVDEIFVKEKPMSEVNFSYDR